MEMSAHNSKALRFYRKLGFRVLKFAKGSLPPDNVLVLGRSI